LSHHPFGKPLCMRRAIAGLSFLQSDFIPATLCKTFVYDSRQRRVDR
jgi:hypothetical protein